MRIQRAIKLVKGSYSASDVRLVFPLDPVRFFIEDVAVRGEQIAFE